MATKIIEYTVNEDILVKDFIKKYLSRHFYKHSKNISAIYLENGVEVKTYNLLHQGSIFQIKYEIAEEKAHVLVEKDIQIVYEDNDYIIVNKPYDLLSIPSKSEIDSVFNRLCYYLKDTPYFPHILNRLDKETKGLVLVAKHKLAASLAEAEKKYLAITKYKLSENVGRIDLPIKKSLDSTKREINETGQRAVTNYKLIKEENGLYYYDIKLETGRTHQIRLHFSHLGSPLINDKMYGTYEDGDLGLICYNIKLTNPFTNNLIDIKI